MWDVLALRLFHPQAQLNLGLRLPSTDLWKLCFQAKVNANLDTYTRNLLYCGAGILEWNCLIEKLVFYTTTASQ